MQTLLPFCEPPVDSEQSSPRSPSACSWRAPGRRPESSLVVGAVLPEGQGSKSELVKTFAKISWTLFFFLILLKRLEICLIMALRRVASSQLMLLKTFWGLLVYPSLWISHATHYQAGTPHLHKEGSEEVGVSLRWALNIGGGLWDSYLAERPMWHKHVSMWHMVLKKKLNSLRLVCLRHC